MDEFLNKNIPILLVEDDEDDICMTQRAFKKGCLLNKLYVVRNGDDALDFNRIL